jgi:hypothetical protein
MPAAGGEQSLADPEPRKFRARSRLPRRRRRGTVGGMTQRAADLPVDVDVLREEIRRTYADVSTDPDQQGGRLQVADVVIHHEVSEDARKLIDLWTG